MNLDTLLDELRGPYRIVGPITSEDWNKVIERRLVNIRALWHTFTLPALGDVKWTMDGGGPRLRECAWRSHPGDAMLKTKGIFWCNTAPKRQIQIGETAEMPLWMFTRGNEWMTGKLLLYKEPRALGLWNEIPVKLITETTTLDALVQDVDQAHLIWNVLGNEIQRWFETAKANLELIEQVFDGDRMEAALFCHSQLR